MEKINATISFTDGDTKDIELTEIELIALTSSKIIGTNGKYYEIDRIIFEDSSHLNEKNSISIILGKKM